ncbi:MAG: hypothetical protein ACI915_004089 [Gammaproteobacteria bacterium]|jgi:hypothetical protein
MNPKLVILVLFTALVAMAAGNANAILVVETTPITWTGICTDCNEVHSLASATLGIVHAGNVDDGTDIGSVEGVDLGNSYLTRFTNLQSFEYESDLYHLFATDIISAVGRISTGANTVAVVLVEIEFLADQAYSTGGAGGTVGSWKFRSFSNGDWDLSNPYLQAPGQVNFDQGLAGSGRFNIPEPSTVFLTSLGLVAFGFGFNRNSLARL